MEGKEEEERDAHSYSLSEDAAGLPTASHVVGGGAWPRAAGAGGGLRRVRLLSRRTLPCRLGWPRDVETGRCQRT